MKLKLLAGLILGAGLALAQTHIAIGVGGYGPGYYPPPPRVYVPVCPGPGYVWTDGYWDSAGGRSFWRNGYWVAPRAYGRVEAWNGNAWHGREYYGGRDAYRHYSRPESRRDSRRDERRGRGW
jgi:hypothetical protein